MSRSMEFEAFYPYPPEKVWVALTDKRALAEWMMANDFEPRVGHKFHFRVDPQPGFNGEIACEVTECEPPRKLVYRFQGTQSKQATLVTWDLVPERDGTRLKLVHSGFTGIGGFILSRILKGGWGKMLPALISRVLAAVGEDRQFKPGAVPMADRTYTASDIPSHFESSPDL